jgi:dsRNA-specific ribonuclease
MKVTGCSGEVWPVVGTVAHHSQNVVAHSWVAGYGMGRAEGASQALANNATARNQNESNRKSEEERSRAQRGIDRLRSSWILDNLFPA